DGHSDGNCDRSAMRMKHGAASNGVPAAPPDWGHGRTYRFAPSPSMKMSGNEDGASSQVRRVPKRFALAASGGERGRSMLIQPRQARHCHVRLHSHGDDAFEQVEDASWLLLCFLAQSLLMQTILVAVLLSPLAIA